MKKSIITTSAFVLIVMLSSVTFAATFDYDTGIGYVGKGEVQGALGMTNKQVQDRGIGLSFTFAKNEKFEADCHLNNGQTVRQIKEVLKIYTVFSQHVRLQTQVNSHITGFRLDGFIPGIPPSMKDEEPVLGAGCSDGNQTGSYSSVNPTERWGTLYVENVRLGKFW